MSRQRPVPAATPGFKLTPEVKRPRVGDVDPEPDTARPAARPVARPGRSRGGRRPAPAVETAVPTTVRFDPDEAVMIDRFVLDLRDASGRSRLDKAEVVRELLRLAMEHDVTQRALLRRLR